MLDAGRDPARARAEMALVQARHDGPFGVRLGADAGLGPDDLPRIVDTVLVADAGLVGPHRAAGRRVLAEATSLGEAQAALDAGADGVVAKGAEAGGRVGEETAFVLLQRLVAAIDAPLWLQGGIGLDTAAAAIAGGARGVVLDAQLALARDASLPPEVRTAVGAMDGSETVVVGGHRVFTRPDLTLPGPDARPDDVAARLGADDLRTQLLPIGQDGSFARPLADRYKTAGGIVGALRTSIAEHIAAARELRPLAPGAGTAATRGTVHPIAQGPMTRVSDRSGFAAAVADGGALPFLALSLMRGDEIRTLLAETADAVGERPWGVGILGFVPPELREEQLAVVRELRPPVALIAGGRPSQAAPLEAEGITTFLHVPSPGLLDRFWKDGARRFVFEGRECGGHVGPRSSFALWQRQIDRLLQESDLSGVEVFFAGGIHDARSSAMVAAMAAPLADRGAAVGVLMGTAYVMTTEAVETGAITQTFLDEAVTCADTVLLETSPGHATRCVASEYVTAFERRKAELVAAGTDVRDMWTELEGLNLGRLRIASKGLVRDGDVVTEVGDDVRRREGMFMIGQVAALRDGPTTIAALHRDVSEGATALLDDVAVPASDERDHGGSMGIAVIGTAAVFPGAVGVDQFWANVVGGVDGISEVPAHRWSIDRYYDAEAVVKDAGVKTPSKWGGFLPDVPFDPMRYGIPPRSITSIGNDQLLSLEIAAAALADAGYADRPFDRERTSVVFGAETGTDLAQAYGFRAALPHFVGDVPEALSAIPKLTEDSFPGVLANVIAGRIANRLDLGGANYTVDAACGASMAALSAACGELTSGASDMVLCGGTDLHNGIYDYLLFAATHALSPTGRCRTFDCVGRRHLAGRGRRLHRAQAGGGRRARRRPHPGRHRRGVGVERRAEPRADRTAARGPAAGARARLRPFGRVAGRHRPGRGARHRHGRRRPHRAGDAHRRVLRTGRGARVDDARLGQVADRPHQVRGRHRRHDQGGPRPAPRGAAADAQHRRAERGVRPQDQPVRVRRHGPPLGRRRPARRGQRLRLRRVELPRRPVGLHRRRRARSRPRPVAGRAVRRSGRDTGRCQHRARPPGRPAGRQRRRRPAVAAARPGPHAARPAARGAGAGDDRGRRPRRPGHQGGPRPGGRDGQGRVPGPDRLVAGRRARRRRPGGRVPVPRSGQPAAPHAGRPVRGLPRDSAGGWRSATASWSSACSRRRPSARPPVSRPRPSPTRGWPSPPSGSPAWR